MPHNDTAVIVAHRLDRAGQTAGEARFNYQNGFLGLAENRIYYAMFYAVSALALQQGFSTSKHAQLKGWFNKEFVASGKIEADYYKIYHRAFERRQEGDYDDFVTFEAEEVAEDLENMERFLRRLEKAVREASDKV